MRKLMLFVLVIVVGFLAGWNYYMGGKMNTHFSNNAFEISYDDLADTMKQELIVAEGNWKTTPTNVTELYSIADVVIHGKIVEQTERLDTQRIPTYGPIAGIENDTPIETVDNPEEFVEIVGETTAHVPFTDSTVAVLKAYKGNIEGNILVSQIGGVMPNPFDEEKNVHFTLEGNVIFSPGTEYVLFLTETDQQLDGNTIFYLAHPIGSIGLDGNELVTVIDEFTVDNAGFPRTWEQLQQQLQEEQRKEQ